jgi:hypothetical protein
MLQAPTLREEWQGGMPSSIEPPTADAKADKSCQSETGDPHWEEERFGRVGMLDLYNVLLLRKRGGECERVGVGKVSASAFWAAQPEEEIIILR